MTGRECFKLCFWGVRGSYPTPGPDTVRHGGNTSCIEVQAGTHTLIFDAGSGIIRLGDGLFRRAAGQSFVPRIVHYPRSWRSSCRFPVFVPLSVKRRPL